MSAAAQRRGPLKLVPDPAPGDDPAAQWLAGQPGGDVEQWQADAVITQWEPEHQLVGALMWLTADRAAPILELVPDAAMWRPMTRITYEIIRGLVEAGLNPEPVVVLRTAKRRPSRSALHPDQPTSAGRYRDFAVYLANAYTQTLTPAAAPDYAREVLDEAYRRAFRTNGIRMQQLGECGAAERADLTEQFAGIRDELADLWRRAEAAAKPDWWRNE